MSPIGGVGIDLAVQHAVAAANVLAEPLRRGTLGEAPLAAVQRRRMLPTRLMILMRHRPERVRTPEVAAPSVTG